MGALENKLRHGWDLQLKRGSVHTGRMWRGCDRNIVGNRGYHGREHFVGNMGRDSLLISTVLSAISAVLRTEM